MTAKTNPFDQINLEPVDVKKTYDRNPDRNPFDEIELNESWGKSIARALYQIPSGVGQALTYPLDLMHMMGVGDALDPEEIDRIRMISEREGIPFDEQKYVDAAQAAAEYFPTQGNIEKGLESNYGLPLTPKTGLQKGIKLASSAGGFAPGGLLPKGVAAASAPAISQGLQYAGIPESLADIGGLGLSSGAALITPNVTIGKATKPSGLTTRRYESLTKPTEISQSRLNKINESVEGDFRKITQDLIKESPVENTYTALKEDMSFKNAIGEKFREVEALSKDIPGEFPAKELKTDIAKVYQGKETKGITPSEYDKDYNKFMKGFLKETPDKNITAAQLVEQYRKNNKSLSELFEPGKSKAHNRAKKDALLDYNKVIASVIEKQYPDTEFSELFKFTNKRWSEIKDSEYIDKFIDDMFKGKVNYEKGKKFFDKNSQDLFKRALGEENYPKFEQLMGDLMSTEQANKLLKVGESKGLEEWAKKGIYYLVHPKALAAKVGYDHAKSLYQMLLDKPKLSIVWDDGIQAMKKGNFQEAKTKFSMVEKELTTKQKAVLQYNQSRNKPISIP